MHVEYSHAVKTDRSVRGAEDDVQRLQWLGPSAGALLVNVRRHDRVTSFLRNNHSGLTVGAF